MRNSIFLYYKFKYKDTYDLVRNDEDCISKFILADMYYDGSYLEMDKPKALKIFSDIFPSLLDLEKKHDIDAIFCLGHIYRLLEEYEKAIIYLTEASICSYPYALCELGYMYLYGIGVKKSYSEAYKYFSSANKNKSITSLYYLGYMYENGYGVVKSFKNALALYKKAAKLGHKDSLYYVGEYYFYKDSFPKKFYTHVAAKYIYRAADMGHPLACSLLGEMYQYGNGVIEDVKKAKKWYSDGAALGDKEAQFKLAMLYFHGQDSVEQDYGLSAYWLEKSADLGYVPSMYFLARMYYDGNGMVIYFPKALEYFTKAANENHAEAMYYLGRMYHFAEGVDLNEEMASYWLKRSIEYGYSDAKKLLDEIK